MFAQIGYYICVPFAWLTRLFYSLTGSYGLALILFTLVVKLVILPFQLKSKKSMLRMNRMQGKVKDIQTRFANNRERQQQEMADLYAREGVNPMSGCLWSFIPFPILIALYAIIRTPLRYFMSLSTSVIEEIGTLAGTLGYEASNNTYDQIYLAKFIHEHWESFAGKFDGLVDLNYSFLGMDLASQPSTLLSQFPGGGWPAGGESSVVQDGESDTESSPRFAVSRRRSKRARRRAPPPAVASSDPEQPASSVSDATPEEDVAMSLVMLSRDSWTRRSRPGPGPGPDPRWGPASSGADRSKDGGVRSFVGADDEADREHGDVARPRGRHRCGVCRKVFRSYQALGGHRASVKKGKGGCVPVPVPPSAAAPSPKARRGQTGPAVHECPFCSRVFESGQALGGHKRAHVAHGVPAPWTPARCGDSSGSIDLNVPAATDDDFELSAVYDTEFGGNRQ